MATSYSAQEVISCDLCVKPVQKYCNGCQLGLCEECINKHKDSLRSTKHNIVPFKDRTVQTVLSNCTLHPNHSCGALCQDCDVPICIKCVTASHQGHKLVDMQEVFARKREMIKRETEEIEGFISKQTAEASDIDNMIWICTVHFKDLIDQAKDQRKQWHLEVDSIFDNLESLILSSRKNQLTVLKSCQSKLKTQTSSMFKYVQENIKLLRSNKISAVKNYKSRISLFRNVPKIPYVVQPLFQTRIVKGSEQSIAIGNYVAKLTQTPLPKQMDEVHYQPVIKLLTESKIYRTFLTHENRNQIACVGSDKAWISGNDKQIRLVDIHGCVQQRISSTCAFGPGDIAVNQWKELMFSDTSHGHVNLVRNNKSQTIITIPEGWLPKGLCCTRTWDILVSLGSTDMSQNKIVRYRGDKIIQEVNRNELGNPIYKGGSNMTSVKESINGDIVVGDTNAGQVVVVDSSGKLRFRYHSKPPRGNNPFRPAQVVTDTAGNIIVVDQSNSCLHILDQDGRLLRYVENCGLKAPGGLSIDSEGRLWVASYKSGEVTVIQYSEHTNPN